MQEELEILECTKCGLQVEQILALQCEHNLCLTCSAKILYKQTNHKIMKCEICGQCTVLDINAAQIILESSGQWQYESATKDQKEQMSQSLLQSEPPFQTICSKKTEIQISCQNHLSEIAQLYCLGCQTTCFCMECYLQGLHKNHDVKNTQKYYNSFKQTKVDQIWSRIKQSQDTILNDQCKLTNKKRELIEIGSIAKLQIQQSFESLYQILKQKEQELTSTTDELINEKLQILDQEIQKIKKMNEKLNDFSEQLNYSFEQQSPQVEYAVQAFNYVANNYKKIDNLIDGIVQQAKIDMPLVAVNYTLDQQSVVSFMEDIKTMKLKITSLKAIDQNDPTQKEKFFYEKAKEERSKRLFKSIVKTKEHNDSPSQDKENNSQLMNSRISHNIDQTLSEFQKKFQEVKRQMDLKN